MAPRDAGYSKYLLKYFVVWSTTCCRKRTSKYIIDCRSVVYCIILNLDIQYNPKHLPNCAALASAVCGKGVRVMFTTVLNLWLRGVACTTDPINSDYADTTL